MEALPKRIIVKPDEKPEVTKGGLHYVGSYNEEKALRRGEDISIGKDVTDLEVGDRVAYLSFTGRGIEHEGERYLTMYESEVIGKEVYD